MSTPANRIPAHLISKLTLGTVQFGKPYGVANTKGQPSFAEVLEILAAALEHGITAFDTAAAYGTSEEVLGRALKELAAREKAFVMTKVPHLKPGADSMRAKETVRESVESSCRKLGLEVLPLVLLHSDKDVWALDALMEQVDRGLVRTIGVSCGNLPEPAVPLTSDARVAALQIPCSLLDLRFQRAGVPAAALRQGQSIFVRSIYLQGLILMEEEQVPPFLRDVIPVRRALAAIAEKNSLTPAEMALRFILSLEGVTSVLTGVETKAQLLENIAIAAQGPLPQEVVDEISRAVPELPELLLTPLMWELEFAKLKRSGEA